MTGDLLLDGDLQRTDRAENTVTTTTDSSGDVVVNHGLGFTPTSITITPQGTGATPLLFQVIDSSINGTSFTVRFFGDFSTALNAGSVKFSWSAE